MDCCFKHQFRGDHGSLLPRSFKLSVVATVAINTVFLNPDRRGGAETYTRQLVAELQKVDSEFDFLILTSRHSDLRIDHPRFQVVTCTVDPRKHKRRILFEELRLPGILASHRPDIVHFPYGSVPRLYRGRSVVTIHDTVRHFLPDQLSFLEHNYKRFVDSNLIARSVPVISVSRADGDAMCVHLGFSCTQIHPIHLGVGEVFREAARQHRGQPKEDYMLWVGRPYESKNVPILLRAIAILMQRGVEVPLLRLVGPDSRQRKHLDDLKCVLEVPLSLCCTS